MISFMESIKDSSLDSFNDLHRIPTKLLRAFLRVFLQRFVSGFIREYLLDSFMDSFRNFSCDSMIRFSPPEFHLMIPLGILLWIHPRISVEFLHKLLLNSSRIPLEISPGISTGFFQRSSQESLRDSSWMFKGTPFVVLSGNTPRFFQRFIQEILPAFGILPFIPPWFPLGIPLKFLLEIHSRILPVVNPNRTNCKPKEFKLLSIRSTLYLHF